MARTSTRPRASSPLHLTSAFALFGKSYRVVRANLELFILLYAIGGLFALWDTLGRYVDDKENGLDWGDRLASGFFGPEFNAPFYASAGGFLLIFFALYMLSYLLSVILTLRAAGGERPRLGRLWREFTAGWLWLKLLGAIMLMALAIVLGFLLLIIPGLILVWRLFFVPYVLIDQKTSISEAFARSWDMTRGYFLPIYSVILVTLLLSLTNLIPVLGSLVAFVLGTIYSVAPALRYHELKKLS